MFSLDGLFGTGKPPQQVAITKSEVAPTATLENQPAKTDTREAIYNLRTKMQNEVFSKYKPQLHEFIQGISGEIYNTSLNSKITEQINTIITELYSKSKEQLTKIDPAITVNMFETSDIQLPSKISEVFQLKTKEYLAGLETFYLSRIESVLHEKFNPLLPDTPKRPVEPKYKQRPDEHQYAEWRRHYEGGGLSRFSKKKKKTKKKRRPTKKRKTRLN